MTFVVRIQLMNAHYVFDRDDSAVETLTTHMSLVDDEISEKIMAI